MKQKEIKKFTPLPPKIPQSLADLDRAIMMLGNRTKSEFGPKPRRELEELLGAYPSQGEASAWKHALKSVRKEQFEKAE